MIIMTLNSVAAAKSAGINAAWIFKMTYLLIYLSIGAITFYPMLLWDKECAKHLSGLPWQGKALAFAMWTVVWALSIFYDLCDWLFPESDE